MQPSSADVAFAYRSDRPQIIAKEGCTCLSHSNRIDGVEKKHELMYPNSVDERPELLQLLLHTAAIDGLHLAACTILQLCSFCLLARLALFCSLLSLLLVVFRACGAP